MINELKKLKEALGADQIKVGMRDNTVVVEARKMSGNEPVVFAYRFSADDFGVGCGSDCEYIKARFSDFISSGKEVSHG